jgi:ADP-sugar diphosphatase
MLDDETGNFGGKAAAEIKEEVGIEINSDDLFNMSEAATSDIPTYPWTTDTAGLPSETVQNSMYPSAGGCDEFIPLMLCQKRLTHDMMKELNGKATGLRDEGENITLKVVPLKDLWKEGGRDAKALAALSLYEGLRREGRLPEMPMEPDVAEK